MLAAIAAARRQASVALLEQNDRPGKKLLSTGNGKCNYTNEKQDFLFTGSDPALMPVFLSLTKPRWYPFSQSWGSILSCVTDITIPTAARRPLCRKLEAEVRRLGVSIACGQRAASIQKRGHRFSLPQRPTTSRPAHALWLRAGWRRRKPVLTDSACGRRKPSGTESFPPIPLWCPLTAKGKFLSPVGRCARGGRVSLYVDGHLECEDEGNFS